MTLSPYISHDFENGIFDLDRNPNSQVPSRIETDDSGRAYLRIEANYGDQDWIPKHHEDRVRSFVWATERHHKMDPLTEQNKAQSYSADLRFQGYEGARGPVSNQVFELFQTSSTNPESSYGDKTGDTGPNIRLTHTEDGTIRASYTSKDAAGKTIWHSETLGKFAEGVFYNFRIDAVWSHDPKEGRYDIYVDGALRKSIENIATTVGPTADLLPSLKIGLYGDNAVGAVDVDNIEVALIHPEPQDTTQVHIDTSDQFVWSQIIETFSASGDLLSLTRTFDDGRVTELSYAGGIRTQATTWDLEDARDWSQTTVGFDDQGARVSQTRLFDDGSTKATTYLEGIRSQSVLSDAADVFLWSTEVITYDAAGTRTDATRTYDDGMVIDIAFLGGQRSQTTATDVENTKPWHTRTVTFDETGRALERTTVFDDGRIKTVTYDLDLVLERVAFYQIQIATPFAFERSERQRKVFPIKRNAL